MTPVAVTQRVIVDPAHGERRDCLDQAWTAFLRTCGLAPIPVPNLPDAALDACRAAGVCGLVLTGGNDLFPYGGDAPERDATEHALLDRAAQHAWPVLAVCRGMQLLQHRHAIGLQLVQGHVQPRMRVCIDGSDAEVNSYHRWAATRSKPPLQPFAYAADGVIKAVRDPNGSTIGLMWHPELMVPFSTRDIDMCRTLFKVR